MNIFYLILAPFEHFIVNFSESYSFKGAGAGYVCLFWLDSSPPTESTRSETPCQLSQCGVRLHVNWVNAVDSNIYKDFIIHTLTRLTWSLTLCWLSWRSVSLSVESVDEEWDSASTESPLNVKNLNKLANSRTKSKTFRNLLYGLYVFDQCKKREQKISCKCTSTVPTKETCFRQAIYLP